VVGVFPGFALLKFACNLFVT